jgi:hypothetical protein
LRIGGKNVKKWLLIFGGTFFVCSIFLTEKNQCFASENDKDTSTGSVRLTTNFDSTDPKKPENPNVSIGEQDPLNPSTKNPGPLSLDVVPKGFYFGSQKMFHAAHDYFAIGQQNYKQYIQVTDNRDAGVYGWSVLVRQDRTLKDDSTGSQLTGAYLNLPKGIATSTNSPEDDHLESELDTNSIVLDYQDQKIFSADISAEKAQGKGTSIDSWDSQAVALHIPKETAKAGNYTNTIYWTLATEITH